MDVLSLRGGGMRGLCTAQFLACFEKDTKKSCNQIFDLFVGTSTGGILAVALGLGINAQNIVDFYTEDGPRIFSRRVLHYFGIVGAKYNGKILHAALMRRFQSRKMGDCRTPTMVTITDMDTLGAKFVKSWRHGFVDAADACTATSAAPTYFDMFIIPLLGIDGGGRFADGGMFANNPALCALSEARELDPLHPVRLVDVACPSGQIKGVRSNDGLDFGSRMVDVFMNSGMDAVETICDRLINENYLKIEPPLGEASAAMDDASDRNMRNLIAAGEAAYEQFRADLWSACKPDDVS